MPLDKAGVIRKWKPIMEALNVKDDKRVEFFSEYAEHYARKSVFEKIVIQPIQQIKKTIKPDIDPYGEEDWDDAGYKSENTFSENLLPVSLKILSKLNLEGKNLSIEEGMPNYEFRLKMSRDQIFNLRGLDIVQRSENILMEEMITHINHKLETNDNLRITSIAQSLSVISDENMNAVVVLMGRFEVN